MDILLHCDWVAQMRLVGSKYAVNVRVSRRDAEGDGTAERCGMRGRIL